MKMRQRSKDVLQNWRQWELSFLEGGGLRYNIIDCFFIKICYMKQILNPNFNTLSVSLTYKQYEYLLRLCIYQGTLPIALGSCYFIFVIY